ncbi:MAG: xanthine dehydrogenase family protein subunit M [Anaerolineae bacterium]
MYPAKFDYYRAGSVGEAIALLGQTPDAKIIAGGHSLLPLMKLRLATPAALIDIGRIEELKGISEQNGGVLIGALATHDRLAHAEAVKRLAPAIADAAGHVGDQQVRNRGTIGGNIAHADPASDLPTVLLALDAEVIVQGPGGQRRIPAADFFVDLMTTSMEPDEILTAVFVPAAPKSAYVKYAHPASGYAMIGACAALDMDGGAIRRARVAIGGATPTPRRLVGVEAGLAGQSLDFVPTVASSVGDSIDDWMGDIQASSEYRRAIAPVFVERAINAAASR